MIVNNTAKSGSSSQSQCEQLQGVVERLTFHSPESGYSVARLKAPGNRDLITIVGSFANIQAGQTLKLLGFWQEHPKFGQQFNVTQYQETKPSTFTRLEKCLSSGRMEKGVDLTVGRRQKKKAMSWRPKGSRALSLLPS